MKQRELIDRALGSSTLSRQQQQEPVMELKPVAPPKVCLIIGKDLKVLVYGALSYLPAKWRLRVHARARCCAPAAAENCAQRFS
jgi:hypothetical protein